MKQRLLGQTGIHVSSLGLGTVKFGRNQGVKYPQAFEIPSMQFLANLLSEARDLGITLLDTAPSYGSSEERLGVLLKGSRRDWVLVSKTGEKFFDGISHYCFDPTVLKKSVEESLQRLKTDYMDVVLIHSDGQDEALIQAGVFDCLQDLKKEGKILAVGMSTKTVSGGLLCVEQADVVMVTYHPQHQEEETVLDRARECGKGVLIKKALCSGHLEQLGGSDPVRTALSFVFKHTAVSSVIIGTVNAEHLRHNAAVMELIDA